MAANDRADWNNGRSNVELLLNSGGQAVAFQFIVDMMNNDFSKAFFFNIGQESVQDQVQGPLNGANLAEDGGNAFGNRKHRLNLEN